MAKNRSGLKLRKGRSPVYKKTGWRNLHVGDGAPCRRRKAKRKNGVPIIVKGVTGTLVTPEGKKRRHVDAVFRAFNFFSVSESIATFAMDTYNAPTGFPEKHCDDVFFVPD